MRVLTPKRLVTTIIAYAALSAVFAITLFAQITTTGIRGIVRDPSGAVIPNASIKLTDNATGIELTTISSSDGGFLFPNLQFGSHWI